MLMHFLILSVKIKIGITFSYVKMKSGMQGTIGTVTLRLFFEKIQTVKINIRHRYHDGVRNTTMDILAHKPKDLYLRCTYVLCVCDYIMLR